MSNWPSGIDPLKTTLASFPLLSVYSTSCPKVKSISGVMAGGDPLREHIGVSTSSVMIEWTKEEVIIDGIFIGAFYTSAEGLEITDASIQILDGKTALIMKELVLIFPVIPDKMSGRCG